MRRIISWMILTLLLVSTFILAFDVGLVRAQAPQTVYISSDGSVAPSSAPISTLDNVTYTFTGNISYPTYNGIIIEKNNIVIDGNGYAIQGNNSGNVNDHSVGLSLTDTGNVTIENANIENFQIGIYLSGSNNIITGNNATANYSDGIYLDSSSNDNTISGNKATANARDGIALKFLN